MAYSNLQANQGRLTPGTNAEDTIDGMSSAKIEALIQQLGEGSFRWQPAKRVYIAKANGKRRPLSIPTWTDKLVQEGMRLILEAYYEPRFSAHSHGFRPQRGCHSALGEIVNEWRGVKWFIEGDIQGCFDHIDHDRLLQRIGKDIKDEKFLKLLREMLKAGYMEGWQYQGSYSGTPQGGILSPLLANIYLHELDEFVETELLPRYNLGARREANPAYNRLGYQLRKAVAEGNDALAHHLRKTKATLPSVITDDPNYRRLGYVRYADDFILGYAGTKAEAECIKAAISTFLTSMKLTLSAEKTLITHAAAGRAKFLNYEVTVTYENSKKTAKRRIVNGRIALRVPLEVCEKWIRKYQRQGKTVHDSRRLLDSDYDIVTAYGAELRGLVNYYTMALNVRRLGQVKYVLQTSLVKTLAAKHKQSVAWVYRKYRQQWETTSGLAVKIERVDKPPLIATFGADPMHYQRLPEYLHDRQPYTGLPKRRQFLTRLLAETCELCGNQTQVEVHHIKSIRQLTKRYRNQGKAVPPWIQRMAEMYRNTLVVCKPCHLAIHQGTYDGKKLASA